MRHYNHLTLFEREKLMYFQAKNYSVTAIANGLHRSKSTISRELKRNSYRGLYQPIDAQRNYSKRRRACRPHKRLEDVDLCKYVKAMFLDQQWSPKEIAGRLALEHHKTIISYSTIYREIYAGRFDDPYRSHGNRGVVRKLCHRGKTRRTKNHVERRGKIRLSNDISQRPAGAQNRSRRGHWEGDTVVGKKGKACLVTLVDRKTRYLIGGKASAKCSDAVNATILRALAGYPVKSITPDRGKEFAKHEDVTATLDGVKFYFPKPYRP